MNFELFTKQLDEIIDKITKLELKENEEDNSWKVRIWYGRNNWPDEKTCLMRKVDWQSLKNSIEKKISLIKEIQISANAEEKNNYFLLLSRYSNKLAKVEEKISKLEAHLADAKNRQITQWILQIICGIIIIVAFVFILRYIVFKKP